MAVIVLIAFASCSKTPTEKLIEDAGKFAEDNLKPKLKDPSSFEKVKVEITDTVYTTEFLDDIIKSNLDRAEHYIDMSIDWADLDIDKSKEFLQNSLSYQKSVDSLKTVKGNTPKNEVTQIIITYTFRAKNGFGALDLGSAKVCYIPSDQKFVYWGTN
jgi:hypothetical protein